MTASPRLAGRLVDRAAGAADQADLGQPPRQRGGVRLPVALSSLGRADPTLPHQSRFSAKTATWSRILAPWLMSSLADAGPDDRRDIAHKTIISR
jgi:hypothetical protein